jgi:hypothetical protein
MDLESTIKIATFFLGLVGATKIIYEIGMARRFRMRDEYKFAKDFFDALDASKPMHPFVREKGFQAIAGDNQLSANEVEYLLSLEKPDRALKDYVLGKKYLNHLPQMGSLQIAFKTKYQKNWPRKWRKTVFLVSYAVSFFLVFLPILLPKLFSNSATDTFVLFSLTSLVFGPYAWFSLMTAGSIHRAEKLVERQSKHTQSILVGESVTQRIA